MMKEKAKKQAIVLRLKGETSCAKCQYFYAEEVDALLFASLQIPFCALNKNPQFTDALRGGSMFDRFAWDSCPAVSQGMCASYLPRFGSHFVRHPKVSNIVINHIRRRRNGLETETSGSSKAAGE